ncbi:MAG: type II toxin-antitoxin system VapC family toxin [Alphaproteobacteria bacterium]|uniref:Type II toxin-antitoxin system VapC family toxin n=1 Tax=Candidatus Nitrobium versatile TaxID=2884831 RepID=A0A953M232_9BACT|nr:type II toxin-antitoxin system VapC family toxin [Candidatus Nitrobium versatile]
MILYLGTSSLVKLYLDEPHSALVREWAAEAEIIATCRVAYTEIIAALDIRFRQEDLSRTEYDSLVNAFSRDWPHFAVIDFDDMEAGRLVNKYGLRRFDALHLSAAKIVKECRGGLSFVFSSVDKRLREAAAAEGMRVVES